jgi:hypothetical protein
MKAARRIVVVDEKDKSKAIADGPSPDGDTTLVLDTGEVQLAAGDTVVQRGANHAWSNRSEKPCTVAFSSHDGAW